MVRFRLHTFGRNNPEVIMCPSLCIVSGSPWCQFVSFLVISTSITWLRWCLRSLFDHKVTILPSVFNIFFVERYSETKSTRCYSSNTLLVLATSADSRQMVVV